MKKGVLFLSLLVFYALFSFGQNNNVIDPVVNHPIYFDISPPLRDMVKNFPKETESSWKDGIVKNKFNVRKRPVAPQPGGITDPGLQSINGVLTTSDTTLANFDGNYNTEGVYPPDTHGDVGPNHYFQVVNCHYAIYNKTGTLLFGPVANSSMWSGFTNNTNSGDAVVIYDDQADRWLFSQFSLPNYPNGPFFQMIAVSQTGDPTGSWYRWQYSYTNMDDYPKFAVWGDGYYMSAHLFAAGTGTYAGIMACAFDRAQMLAGNSSPIQVTFTKPNTDEAYGWLPSDCDGPFPAGTPPNYFVYPYDGVSNDHLGIYEFHADWVTPANSTFGNFLSLPVNAFTTNNTGVIQPGTGEQLNILNDRMMYRLQYRHFADHEGLVCNHSVDISSSVTGIRWYELRKTSGPWSIYQQSTYSISDGNSRWMASIAMDSSGNIGLGYSVSGPTLYPSIRYCGRRKNDPLNTMTIAERGIINGAGSQTGTADRWGDYSALSCDPVAKATYWYTQEYYSSTSSTGWKTRIAEFRFANTPSVVTLPATAVTSTGGTLNGTVNPNGLSTNYHFEWGTTTSYGNSTSTLSAGSGSTAVNESAVLTGLTTGVTYHYRIDATNSDGTANGVDMTFTPGQAIVTTTTASGITMTTATAGGNVTTDGGSPVTARGTCWGLTANPTISGSHTSDGTGTGIFTSSLTGLTSNTTYHNRAYATNGAGTVYGADLTFTTQCGTYTLPFSEPFAGTTIPGCWTQVDHQGNGQIWQFGTISGYGTYNPALTGNYAYLNSDGYGSAGSQNADLISPTINATGFINVTLQFNHYFRWYGGSTATLSYSINNGTTWTTIQTWIASSTNPAAFSQVIAALNGQSQIKIKWNYTGAYGYYWTVNDVVLTGTSSSPTLSVTPANQNVPYSPAGSTNFTVTSNSSWTVVSDQSWCTVNPSGTGNGTITANYTVNTLLTSRIANITTTVAGLSPVVVTVTQAASPPTLSVTPSNQNVPASPAGSTNFTVTSNSSWTVVSDQTWCTVTPSGTGNGTITANYSVNTLSTSRVANITTTVAGLTPVVVTVTQAGATPTLSVTPSNQNVPASPAGTTNFTVTSNAAWVVVSDQTWCTVTPSGNGNGTIVASYAVNTLLTSRVANITVTVSGISPVVVTVTQSGAIPALSVTPSNQNVPANAGQTSFVVTSNLSWAAVSDQTWCLVTGSGNGDGTLQANYSDNTNTSVRVANITVSASGVPDVVVTVTQFGTAPALYVTPQTQSVTSPAGSTNFTVNSNSNWVATSDATWCVVTPSGSGNGNLLANYTENVLHNIRTANITVTVSGVAPVTVSVIQDGIEGIGNIQAGTLRIIPNPATGLFRIVSGISGNISKIDILDLTGRILISRICTNDNDYQFDLTNQPAGCYFVKIWLNDEILVRRLIINK
jgi:hypothetical protein